MRQVPVPVLLHLQEHETVEHSPLPPHIGHVIMVQLILIHMVIVYTIVNYRELVQLIKMVLVI